MSSANVNVTVRSSGEPVDLLKDRPVRILPTGTAGVVYAGEVFPLHSGNTIDLEDDRYDKAACKFFVDARKAIPYSPVASATPTTTRLEVTAWNIEHNRFGNYLVFDATESTAERVAQLMDDIGLGVVRWDSSNRQSVDGYHYDWFVRLKFSGSQQDAYAAVAKVLAPHSSVPPADYPDIAGYSTSFQTTEKVAAEAEELARLAAVVEGLFASVEEWRNSHGQVVTKVVRLEQELDKVLRAERQHRQQLVAEQRRRIDAESTVASMRTLQDDQSTSQTALAAAVKDVEALATERLHRADEDRRAAEELAEEAEADAAKNRARIVELEAELTSRNAQIASTLEEKHKLASYIAELSAADEERARLRVAGRKRQTANGRSSADRFTEAILPNITLSNEALDTLLSIKNPSKVFAVLYELNGGTTVPAKVFKGTNSLRVMEVDRHLHIGDEGKSSDMGRVYYCRTEGRVLVHIHRKQSDNEQRQTVERFAAWCREELSN